MESMPAIEMGLLRALTLQLTVDHLAVKFLKQAAKSSSRKASVQIMMQNRKKEKHKMSRARLSWRLPKWILPLRHGEGVGE